MLVRCIYASRANLGPNEGSLDAILAQSRTNNARQGITGLLIHANDVFLQVLEGGRAPVSDLLGLIMRDPRNKDLQLLSWEEIGERKFASWAMGQVNLASLNPGLLLKYSETAALNPFGMGGTAALALVLEIAASGAILHRGA